MSAPRVLDVFSGAGGSAVGLHRAWPAADIYAGERALRERAMDIDWMNDHELTQAVPPAYAEFLARQYGPLGHTEAAS